MTTPIPNNIGIKLKQELSKSICSKCGESISSHGNIERMIFGEPLICPNIKQSEIREAK